MRTMAPTARGLAALYERVEPFYRAHLGDLDGVRDAHRSPLLADTLRKVVAVERLGGALGWRLGAQARVLDVGCGRGRVLAALRALGVELVTGLDDFGDETHAAADPRVDLARIGAAAVAHDLTRIPWPLAGGAFDLVVCFNTLEHLAHGPRPVLAEVRRVLAPGGLVVLGEPNAVCLYKRLRVLAGRTNYPRFDAWWDQVPWRGHVREAAPGELRRALERAGFATAPEIGRDCELPVRLGRVYPLYGALVALAPAAFGEVLFCAGRAPS